MLDCSLHLAPLLAASLAVGACAHEAEGEAEATRDAHSYLGVQTALLDQNAAEGDMVSIRTAMRGSRKDKADLDALDAYGRCAAAQYALIRGAGFARHVRTLVEGKDGTLRGDAVYVISASLPRGVRTIDAEVTVRDCEELGIPTV